MRSLNVIGISTTRNPARSARYVVSIWNAYPLDVTASRYQVLSIPTAILFDGGEPRSTVIGAYPRGHYERAWADWLA